ncbi:hypothetical protein HDU81_008956 [Chytriomyces hyalinus]|nr:hypothetical protein HDU81_008956 [Chytriomyces hyalinus]
MSRHELLNELVALEEQDTASRLGFAARKRIVIEKLRALGERDVQGGNLDIAPVPVAVSKGTAADDDSGDFEMVETGESQTRLESQGTLMGDENLAVTDDLPSDEELTEEKPPMAEKFLYSLYTDPLVIAAEAPCWWTTKEDAAGCASSVVELAADALCSDIPICSGGPATDELFMYGLYTDAAVIAAEVTWWITREAVEQCSGKQLELLSGDREFDGQSSCLLVLACNGSSVGSRSNTKTRKRKVYRPPFKGLSPRLTQEEINFISLQRLKK